VGRHEGFENQRLCVLPRPLVGQMLREPVTRRLLVTDAGFFPRADGHARRRPAGVEETILIVCTAGSGWFEAGAERTRISASTVLAVPAGLPHAYGASAEDPWTIWWCHVRGSDVPELVRAAGLSETRPTVTLRSVDRVVAMLDEIVTHLERDQSPPRLVACAGVAWHLLTQLTIDQRLPGRDGPLAQAMRFLADRVDGTVRVPDLAAMVGLSASHLSALFHAATGGGVQAHHQALKMARARRLLDMTDLSVTEIAREVGMRDPLYFSRQFKKAHGISPTRYRSLHKG
jgi:AraC-like DNA-binding protein